MEAMSNETIHEKILAECREELTKMRTKLMYECTNCTELGRKLAVEKQAALLALSRLTAFYEWASLKGWVFSNLDTWFNRYKMETYGNHITTEDLYAKFNEQRA